MNMRCKNMLGDHNVLFPLNYSVSRIWKAVRYANIRTPLA